MASSGDFRAGLVLVMGWSLSVLLAGMILLILVLPVHRAIGELIWLVR